MLVPFLLTGCVASELANNEADSSTESAEQVSGNLRDEDDPDEMICRREVVTGSNFRREVCLTRAEREESDRQTQEFFEVTRNRPD